MSVLLLLTLTLCIFRQRYIVGIHSVGVLLGTNVYLKDLIVSVNTGWVAV